MQAETQPSIEMSLREHLLAAGAGQPAAPVTPQHQTHGSNHQDHNIDPAIAGSPNFNMSAGETPESLSENRKGRRELSTSKRAAQNRAAQRAFRQRKEEYIKSLKDQVKEYEALADSYKTVQTENYQLRDYIINLQSRLLESQAELPPPPANIDLSRPPPTLEERPGSRGQGQSQHQNAPTATMTAGAVSQLQQAAAQATAQELRDRKHANDASGYLAAADLPSKRQKDENGMSVSSPPEIDPSLNGA